MKVFLSIGDLVALDADVPFDKEEWEQELLNRARSYYEDVVDDNEAYIPDSVEIECLGCQDQQALIKQAKSWNNEIQSEFHSAGFRDGRNRKIWQSSARYAGNISAQKSCLRTG